MISVYDYFVADFHHSTELVNESEVFVVCDFVAHLIV